MNSILSINNLVVTLNDNNKKYKILDSISMNISNGVVTAVVGESGSGKTLTFLTVMRLLSNNLEIECGSIFFNSKDIIKLDEESLRDIRGRFISFVFQEPMTALNPVVSIEKQMTEILTEHKICNYKMARELSINALKEVGIDPLKITQYPHNFSGGQRQRILIAMALLSNPKLVIADEPTTSLDVVTQIEILNLLRKLSNEKNLSVVLISHNMSVVYNYSDYIYVMYLGQIVEEGKTSSVIENPKHPYTIALLNSIVKLGSKEKIKTIEGLPPDVKNWSNGCRFYGRCKYGFSNCKDKPPKRERENGFYYCWLDKLDREV